jgi:hypothetical protein
VVTPTQICGFFGEYRFLSNFFASPILIDGIHYSTVEHAFQSLKTDGDDPDRRRIAAAPTPGEAKRMGRAVRLRADWEQAKSGVMLTCLQVKFAEPGLASRLAATGSRCLVETNDWHDQCWGDCTCPRHASTAGENRLGKLLEVVRSELVETAA